MAFCMVLWCKNKGSIPGIKYFRLTKSRHDAWLIGLGRDPKNEQLSSSNSICSEHFKEEDKVYTNRSFHLKSHAVPALKLKNQNFVEKQEYLNRATNQLPRILKEFKEEEMESIEDQSHLNTKLYVQENNENDPVASISSTPEIEIFSEKRSESRTCSPLSVTQKFKTLETSSTDSSSLKETVKKSRKDICTEYDYRSFNSTIHSTVNKRRVGGYTCSVKSCKNRWYNYRKGFFRFPRDSERARTWLINCNREELIGHPKLYSRTICAEHFEPEMFTNKYCQRLIKKAIPTLFPLPKRGDVIPPEHNYSRPEFIRVEETRVRDEDIPQSIVMPGPMRLPSLPEESCQPQRLPNIADAAVQTKSSLSNHSPRKEKLRKNIKALKREICALKIFNEKLIKENKELRISQGNVPNSISLEHLQELIVKFCPSKLIADFINSQLSQASNIPADEKIFSEELDIKEEILSDYD